MVIGQEDQKCCPACNSDATWQNRDTAWLIRCPMCETFLIRNSTIEILRSDVVYRTLAVTFSNKKVGVTTCLQEEGLRTSRKPSSQNQSFRNTSLVTTTNKPLQSPPADELCNGYCELRDVSIFLILALSMLHWPSAESRLTFRSRLAP